MTKKTKRSAAPAPAPAPADGPVVRVSLSNPVVGTPLGLTITPADVPRSSWSNVKLEDIGKFEIVTPRKARRPPHLMLEENHKFVTGDSRFIYYVVTPIFKKVAKTPARVPINAENKLTKKVREQFSSQLEASLERLSSFWLQDVLPQTMAVESALDKVDELVLQLTGGPANLPRDLVKRKYEQGISVKLLRFVAQSMKLTKTEHRMLLDHMITGGRQPPAAPQPIVIQTPKGSK
jgi:hypothetical protein